MNISNDTRVNVNMDRSGVVSQGTPMVLSLTEVSQPTSIGPHGGASVTAWWERVSSSRASRASDNEKDSATGRLSPELA